MKRQEEREEAEKAPIKQKLKKELEKLHKQRHKEVSHCACTKVPLLPDSFLKKSFKL